MNDCPPTLPQDNYEVSVSESAPFGSVVLKVTAHDDDGPGRVNNLFYIIFSLHADAIDVKKRSVFISALLNVCFSALVCAFQASTRR